LTGNPDSSPHGGSAAILGFLYQLQATATRLLEARIELKPSANTINSIQVILEPNSGSDAIIEGDERHAIQFKLRNRPIDLGTFADAVLPDLFGAHCEQVCDRYELQSTQRLTKPAVELSSTLASGGTPTAAVEKNFQRARSSCLRVFIEQTGSDSGFDQSFRVFASRLLVAEPIDENEISTKLASQLFPRLPYGNQLETKLDQLTGNLMKRARQNDCVVSGKAIEEILGLASLTDAQETLRLALETALTARQYDPAFDVRAPLPASTTTHLELVSGSSGNGKSWALYRLAQEALENRQPAVLIRASDRSELERELKRLIAIEALDHESPIEPPALGRLWRRRHGDDASNVLVLWEGCQNPEELKQLFYQSGIGEGIRAIAEVPPEADAEVFREIGIEPFQIGEFGVSELFEALSRRGVNAGAVPSSIRRMLRHPVLCGIYAQLAIESDKWNPSNEYLVLNKFWERARQKAGQAAGARLKALAEKMVEKGSREATDSEVLALSFTDEQLGKLASSGWLEHLSGKWRFAHDRLLTWAIAEWLAERLSRPSAAVDEIAKSIEELQNDSPEDRNRLHGLGFLMMDVLWLAIPEGVPADKLGELMALLEEDRLHRSSHSFYRDLCPTLGSGIVEGLLARADLLTDDEGECGHIGNIAAAIRALTLTDTEKASIIQRLSKGDENAWRLLLLLGNRWPLEGQRERVWEGLVEAYRTLGSEQRKFSEFEIFRDAALCLCLLDPHWLENKILSTTDPKELGIASSLLREVSPVPDEQTWSLVSNHLLAHMSSDDHTQIIGFIRRTEDKTKIPFLVEQIEAGSHGGPDALVALAMIDPSAALDIIASKPVLKYAPHAGLWLQRVLDHSPDRGRNLIDQWLMHIDPTGCMLASLWAAEPTGVGSETVAILLRCLAAEMVQEGGGDERIIRILLGVLGSSKIRPSTGNSFRSFHGSRLASELRIRLEAHAQGARNPLAEKMWSVLLRIDGADFETYVLNLLDGPVEARGYGVGSAIFSPTPSVIDRLEQMALDWSSDYSQQMRKPIWRALVSIEPHKWYSRMLALLSASSEVERSLGVELFDDLGYVEDAYALLDCVRMSEVGGDLEARAINLAVHYDVKDPLLLERALPRFRKEKDSEGHLAACNVLLQERGTPARAELDKFLMELTTRNSWNSTDMEVLAIRLRQDDVSEELLEAAEPFMRRPSFFGERIIDPYLERGHQEIEDIVLDRAFAPPQMLTSELPNMIEALARINLSKAEQAFEQAWLETPKRQRYLVPSSRKLGASALQAMLSNLPSKDHGQDSEIAFRLMCIECRRRHAEALPMIATRYGTASKSDRELLAKAISWLPDAKAELERLAANENDPDVRDLVEGLLNLHLQRAEAVNAYRADPGSVPKLLHVLEIVDPEVLYRMSDEWSITGLIQSSGQQTVVAEDVLVRRFNKVGKTRYKKVRIRPRIHSDVELSH